MVDIDIYGREYPCDATISNESYQRAKQLSHEKQRELRRLRIEEQTAKQQQDLAQKQQKVLVLLTANQECKEAVLAAITSRLNSATPVPPEAIREATVEDFEKGGTVSTLKAFYPRPDI